MRGQVVRVAVLVSVVSMLLFALPLLGIARALYVADEFSELERLALNTAVLVGPGPASRTDRVELPGTGTSEMVAVYDRAGHLVLGDGPTVGDEPVRQALHGIVSSTSSAGQLMVGVPLGAQESVYGAVRVTTGTGEVSARLLRTAGLMLGLALMATAIAAVLAMRLARRISIPLEELSRAATALGDGDFTRHPVQSGVPEIDVAGQALERTASRLGRLITREQSFSTHASHQLRTPLTRMRLTLERSLVEPDPDLTATVADTIRSIDGLEQTIDELLHLAREPGAEREPLDVPGLLRWVTDTWHGQLATQGRRLLVRLEPPLPAVRASSAALRNAIQVLVDNAATHGGGQVSVTAGDIGGALCLEVADEGTGIPDGIDPFAAHPSERVGNEGNEGHGIGLGLARDLVEAEGGRLLLVRPGRGTRFRAILPAGSPAAEDHATP